MKSAKSAQPLKARTRRIVILTLAPVTSGWNPMEQLDESAIEWIRTRSSSVRRVCSICVGAFALADAGLLDGRRATTHWRMARDLADRYPPVTACESTPP